MHDTRARRQLEYLTIVLQKSGHALAAYLTETAPGELLLLVPDEDLSQLAAIVAQVGGPHLALTPGDEADIHYLTGASGERGTCIHVFPATASEVYTKNAALHRGRVLFDHPGVFARRRR
jgi:hypothetical protein